MDVGRVHLSGPEALRLATALQQRVRRADPDAGVWEAADLQWWWRRPRPSDAVDQVFWLDGDRPVAAFWLTAWGEGWQADPLVVPGVGPGVGPGVAEVWEVGVQRARELGVPSVEVPVHDDDHELVALASAAGLAAGYTDTEARLAPSAVRPQPPLRPGFRLVDRAHAGEGPHWLAARNGDDVGERLAGCSLYDPSLDLAVATDDGEVAAYAVFWCDPVTQVGLVEPVRVNDAWQRRGLARALLAEGIGRLASRGMRQVKICYGAEDAGSLYRSVGFEPVARTTWFAGRVPEPRTG